MHIIQEEGFRLGFFSEFDERRQFEALSAGYIFDLYVIIEEKAYNLIVYDKVRLEQDIDAENEQYGNGFFYSKNIIVVKEVNYYEIIKSIKFLLKIDFFSSIKEDLTL